MDLLKLGAQLFLSKLGSSSQGMGIDDVTSALGGLLPTQGGDLDLGGLVSQMNGGGLAALAGSFLGDGPNDSFSPSQLMGLLGESKVGDFASKLNIEKDTAASGLAGMIPDLLDQSSSGGNLLGSVGGSVISGLAGKLFGR